MTDLGERWSKWDVIPEQNPVSGVRLQAFTGDNLMVARVRLEPASVIPAHDHPHEQMSVVLEGSLEMTLGGESREMGPGDVVAIPGNAQHGVVVGPSGATVIDVFTPPREDYRQPRA